MPNDFTVQGSLGTPCRHDGNERVGFPDVARSCPVRSVAQGGIEPSVGRVGDSYDNALAESIIGLYKTEVIRQRGPWRHLEAVEFATLEWVHWFNHRRLLEGIGYVPPAELEDAYYQQSEEPAMVA